MNPPSTFLSLLLIAPLLTSSSSIPRSTSKSRSSHHTSSSPPWNPSPRIDHNGFLTEYYQCTPGEWESEIPFTASRHARPRQVVQIRQVPGDGNCLFHSISACLALAENKTHADMRNTTILRANSARLRQAAVDCLSRRARRVLFLQGGEYLRACDLVEAAAGQYNMTGERYCQLMRRDSYWGGGPEIVALCNVLKRPIYVYELMAKRDANIVGAEYVGDFGKKLNNGFCLRRMACFGSPKFDRREPLHILSADSRFPDVSPGRQLTNGNHFLALFPARCVSNNIRGGVLKKSGLNDPRRSTSSREERGSRNVLDGCKQHVGSLFLWEFWMAKLGKLLGRNGRVAPADL